MCIAISRTGSMRPTVEGVMLAGNLGATTVAVTSYKNAPLAKACDYALVAGAPVLGFQVRVMRLVS
ncbi:MAG: SIS domain-containing protein [Chloroflexi bacterium]|nr:SIS domain-containing protein [Chloroflexota bacterium]